MFGGPKQDHAFQQAGARAASAHEQVEIGASDVSRWLVGGLKTIFGGGDLEELHLPPDVVERGDEQVDGPIQWVELRVLHGRQPDLGQQLADESDVASGAVTVLDQPLGERGGGEGTAARVG